MTSGDHNSTCDTFAEWLADALDGTLDGPSRKAFEAHRTVCASCRELLAAATEGRGWLRELPAVEPPPALIADILKATRPVVRETSPAQLSRWLTKLGEGLAAIVYQPRLAMTGAMAFFSLSMIANLTGASVQDLRRLDPRAFASDASLRYHAATAGLVRYYDNNRFLRELEVGLRDLREAAEGESVDAPAAPEQESENHG